MTIPHRFKTYGLIWIGWKVLVQRNRFPYDATITKQLTPPRCLRERVVVDMSGCVYSIPTPAFFAVVVAIRQIIKNRISLISSLLGLGTSKVKYLAAF